jgi:hypothetical protein
MENTKKLVCRKCGGEHLTVKCGKEISKTTTESKPEPTTETSPPVPFKKEYIKTEFKESEKPRRVNIIKDDNEDSDSEKKPRWRKESGQNDNRRSGDNNFRERRPLHKVKMSNLPQDMTEEELLELLYDWGNVIRMRVLNYNLNSTAYIEFKNQDEADYLVKALDKTPFEHIMLSVERLYD